jgi:hypothetical protein
LFFWKSNQRQGAARKWSTSLYPRREESDNESVGDQRILLEIPEGERMESMNNEAEKKDSMNNEAKNKESMDKGAVTFLDVLGWKGIWQRSVNAIDQLLKIIDEGQNYIGRINNLDTLKSGQSNVFKGTSMKILSISDTLVLYSTGDPDKTLRFHAAVTAYLISKSIELGIPLRGATGYGEYSIKESIMIGPVIDEVASWYEIANWIGVIQVPSATFLLESSPKYFTSDEFRSDDFYIPYRVPLKNYPGMKLLCSNWPFYPEFDSKSAFLGI